jgi:hypothetical protein
MLYNIKLIRLDIFFVHCPGLRLVLFNNRHSKFRNEYPIVFFFFFFG